MQNIPNQPVQFDLTQDCSCVEEYVQPFVEGDTFSFQVLTDVGAEEITNGTFDTDLTGWTDSGSGWSQDSGEAVGVGSNLTTNDTPATAGAYIQIYIDCTISLYDPNDAFKILVGAVEVGTITSDGEFYFYYEVPGGGGDLSVTMQAPTSITVRVNEISLKNVNDDGVLFESNCDMTDEPVIESSTPTFVDRLNLAFQNASHPNKDCFRFFVGQTDGVNLLSDPDLCTGGVWTAVGATTYTGTCTATITDTDPVNELKQTISVVEGNIYKLDANPNYNTGDFASGAYVRLGDVYVYGDGRSQSNLIVYFIAGETGSVEFAYGITQNSSHNVVLNTSTLTEYSGMWSNVFKRESCIACLPLITSGDDKSWTDEFSFQNGFEFSLRLEASMKRGSYSYRNDLGIRFTGYRRNLFIEKTKTKILDIAPVPEYIHDALSTMLLFNNFEVNGSRYVFEDTGIEPEWNLGTCLAAVEVPLVPDLQNSKNQC